MSIREDITAFLDQERVAVAGVSRNSRKLGNWAYRALKQAGHTVFPINPNAQSVEGDNCFPNLGSLPEPVSALLIVARPEIASQVLRDAVECGVRRIWINPCPARDADLKAEIERARASGCVVTSGLCPMMFIEPVTAPHNVHRFFLRLFGSYPR